MVMITTPVGRFVRGSPDKKAKAYSEDKPDQFFFAIGIEKGQESHWNETVWGQKIWAEGVEAFNKKASNPAFSWKIVDGDSTVPNKNDRAPCENEGYKGCWVINCRSEYPVGLLDINSMPLVEPDVIKPGCYVQVAIDVRGNKSEESPGVFMHQKFICFIGYCAKGEISFAVDPKSLGFGTADIPADLVSTPVGMTTNQVVAPASLVTTPPVGTIPGPATFVPPSVPLVPVQPYPQILAVTPPPVKRMVEGCPYTYDQLLANGYKDQDMINAGFLLPA